MSVSRFTRDGARRFRSRLEREDQLSGGCERIFAAGHELAARVSALAFNEDAETCRRGDMRYKSEIDSFLLQKRPLFDVQFNELVEATRR